MINSILNSMWGQANALFAPKRTIWICWYLWLWSASHGLVIVGREWTGAQRASGHRPAFPRSPYMLFSIVEQQWPPSILPGLLGERSMLNAFSILDIWSVSWLSLPQ